MKKWKWERWWEDIQEWHTLLQIYPACHLIIPSQNQCQTHWSWCASALVMQQQDFLPISKKWREEEAYLFPLQSIMYWYQVLSWVLCRLKLSFKLFLATAFQMQPAKRRRTSSLLTRQTLFLPPFPQLLFKSCFDGKGTVPFLSWKSFHSRSSRTDWA